MDEITAVVASDYEATNGGATTEARLPDILPTPELPILPLPLGSASGLYEKLSGPVFPDRLPVLPIGSVDDEDDTDAREALLLSSEELRLDVDGRYPLKVASGMLKMFLRDRVHWIANLTLEAASTWSGPIWYKEGNTATFPYTRVRIKVKRSLLPNLRKATVTFMAAGVPDRVSVLNFKSSYYHDVAFEFDSAAGTTAVTSINTGDHPNRPATLPVEALSIEKVYQRSGFNVSRSGDNPIPLAGAGPDARWSDAEMHDAMQTYWSRFANKAQWAMWVFFASLHEAGTSLGGIMFDDIGPNHRQGTAIFNDAFIKDAPAGDPQPAAWVRRMRFWTACHEMGHAFNLAHSWQKALGTPWIPLANAPESRSFMNYPYNVSGGQTAFFANFDFRFDNGELLFMRHAPEKFVQQGNADWFDHHGFEQANEFAEPTMKLQVRANRDKPVFEFLEPVVLEAKLTNVTNGPKIVDENLLTGHDLTIIIKKDNEPAKEFRPYAQRCYQPQGTVLPAGESKYEPLYLFSGIGGWSISEPGRYLIQIALHMENEDVVSNPFVVKITPPKDRSEEFLAQDYFVDEVGRVLFFDGSKCFESANDTLREVVERHPESAAAVHAQMALTQPLTRSFKRLSIADGNEASTSAADAGAKIVETSSKISAAKPVLKETLGKQASRAAETLGHIDYKEYVEKAGEALYDQNDKAAAVQLLQDLEKTLAKRGVLPRVIDEVKATVARYSKGSALK